MKLLVTAAAGLSLFFTSLLGLNAPTSTVSSIHAFEEPLVAIAGDKSAEKDSDLIAALQTYQKRTTPDDVSAITSYIDAHSTSPWKFSLLANLGIVYRKTGYYSRALDAWEQAWTLGKDEKDVKVQALANRVAADLATLLSSLGRTERLESLLAEIKGRTLYGSSGVSLMTANENLWLMHNRPEDSFKCGPFALGSIKGFADKKNSHEELVIKARSSTKGYSLTQVRDLSNKLKMNFQMAKRSSGTALIVPSVTHWKSGHYAAILKKQGNLYLIKDPTFGDGLLVSAQALEDESSGYYLIPTGPLPDGWQTVSDSEGSTIWGRGVVSNRTNGATKPKDKKCKDCPKSHGMAVYNILASVLSLNIEDTPVGYAPPVGPDVYFTITYNQLEANQPSSFTYFNFGPSWSCNWLSYVVVPTSSGGTVTVFIRGGGQETYDTSKYTSLSGDPTYAGYYGREVQSQATLWVTNSGNYERHLPDGSVEVFGQPDAPSSPVRVFLTTITDPKAKSISLGYDSSYYSTTGNLRLSTVTDALGLSTTLSYGLTGDPLKVTQITDPYGRSAIIAYTSSPYQLYSITDVASITSSFTYGTGSVITQMTTPYGNTTFSSSASGFISGQPQVRTLTVTEPDGGQEYAENRLDGANYPYHSSGSFTTEPAPVGYGVNGAKSGDYMEFRNTYFWDKKAMHDAPGDYTKAYIFHFLHTANGTAESPVLESEKPALENRVWYSYPGQADPGGLPAYNCLFLGTSANPLAAVRVIGTSTSNLQVWQYQYNDSHNPNAVTAIIDPLGRQTNYTYDTTNGIDLTGVSQVTASGSATLFSATYNSAHQPLTITDAASETGTFAYNTQGQVTSYSPPTRSGHSAETTTYGYTSNFLTSITKPVSGAVTTIVPDTIGGHTINRPHSISDAESYTITGTYDALDRVTSVTYPDSTTETFSYVNPTTSAVDLDLHSSTDRQGRTTTRIYDSVRHLTSITDPLSRTTQYGWCTCGAMTSLTDAKGNVTYFNRDVESRLTSKVYPGGTQPPTTPDYTYDTVGRVATYTDKRGDVATYSYNLDNTVSGISYSLTSGTAAPPTASYTYDVYYPRLTKAGGTSAGGITLSYVAPGSLGGGQVASITGTLGSGTATVTGTFDEWDRQVGSNVDSANSQSVVFDSLGRVTTATNLTGSFSYSYFDNSHPTGRISTITYPNGQSTTFDYFGNTGDERLKQIKNLTPSSTVLSQFDYTYNAIGTIATWKQQTDNNTPLLWTEGYDNADQLTNAVQTNTLITSPALVTQSYGYDLAGNATSAGISGVTRSGTFNSLNQLTSSTATGNQTIQFTGTTTPTSTVTVGGTLATISGSNFNGGVALVTGTISTVPVVATDAVGNQKTNKYQVSVLAQPNYSPTYDADGNELTNGAGQTYTWDAKNELKSIVYTSGPNSGTHTEFSYDVMGRRIGIIELTGTTVGSGTPTSTKQFVWNGTTLAEERNSSNTVTKRFYAQGEQISSISYYYTRDHLGSVREMTDGSGTIQARYDYDPYGRVTPLINTVPSDFQYAGYYEHATSGLNLTLFRASDPIAARWLSRDPLPDAERSLGPNLYDYVDNDPINSTDLLGLSATWGPNGMNKGCPCGQHEVPLYQLKGYPSASAAASTTLFNANSGIAQSWLAGATIAGAAGNFPGMVNTAMGKGAKGGAAATIIGVALGETLAYLDFISRFNAMVCVPDK